MTAKKPKREEKPSTIQGERLRYARLEAGLNYTELARRADSDRTQIARWEKGERDMVSMALLRVANAIGANVGWLLTGKGDPFQAELLVEPSRSGEPAVKRRAAELREAPVETTQSRPDPRRRPTPR